MNLVELIITKSISKDSVYTLVRTKHSGMMEIYFIVLFDCKYTVRSPWVAQRSDIIWREKNFFYR
jgi:hypothetical protein